MMSMSTLGWNKNESFPYIYHPLHLNIYLIIYRKTHESGTTSNVLWAMTKQKPKNKFSCRLIVWRSNSKEQGEIERIPSRLS